MDKSSDPSGWSYTQPREKKIVIKVKTPYSVRNGSGEPEAANASARLEARPPSRGPTARPSSRGPGRRVVIKETLDGGEEQKDPAQLLHSSQKRVRLVEKSPHSPTPQQAVAQTPDPNDECGPPAESDDEPPVLRGIIEKALMEKEMQSDPEEANKASIYKPKMNNNDVSLQKSDTRVRRSMSQTNLPNKSADQKVDGSMLYNETRAKLNARADTDGGRRYPMLPAECRLKYEPYTRMTLLGLKPIPLSTPEWKIGLMQRKNKQIIEEHLKQRDAERKLRENERKEKEKYEKVPEWMKPIKRKEEKKKLDQVNMFEKLKMESHEEEKFHSYPQWKQELILRKKQQERAELLPSWQRDLIKQRRVNRTKETLEQRIKTLEIS